jgi:hypothetical protein
MVEDHLVPIDHISTSMMIADPLTKGLAPGLYREHVLQMGLSRRGRVGLIMAGGDGPAE